MKLSLYSQLVREGEDHHLVFNNGEIGSKIFDVKTEGALKLTPERSGVFCLLSVNPAGCLLYALKPIFSRGGDYAALILGVPRQVIFSSSADIPLIFEAMRETVADDGDPRRLQRHFEKDYKETDFIMPQAESTRNYAYRVHGGRRKASQLSDLLGTAMLQESYGQYEGVFLLDDSQADLVRPGSMENLSSQAIKQPALVIPPTKSSIPRGCKLFVGKEEMTGTLLSHLNDTINYSLKRDRFEDQDGKQTVKKDIERLVLPTQIQWNYKVYKNCFSIVDESDNRIPSDSINLDVDGILERRKTYFTLPEHTAQNARLKISADTYEPMEIKNVNLMSYSKDEPLVVKLRKKREKVSYKIDQPGQKIGFTLNRAIDEKMTSPLEGYEALEERNGEVLLKPAGRRSKESNGGQKPKGTLSKSALGVLSLLAGLLLGALGGWFLGVPHGVSKHEKMIALMQEKEKQIAKQRADSLTRMHIIAYLDSVPNWKKAEMDSLFEGKLIGLYDALNHYSFEEVEMTLDTLNLYDSKEVQRLDSVINKVESDTKYLEKLKEITKNEENGVKFFSPDGTITLSNLFKHMDTAIKAVDEAAGKTHP